jgi:hypothetical protein
MLNAASAQLHPPIRGHGAPGETLHGSAYTTGPRPPPEVTGVLKGNHRTGIPLVQIIPGLSSAR